MNLEKFKNEQVDKTEAFKALVRVTQHVALICSFTTVILLLGCFTDQLWGGCWRCLSTFFSSHSGPLGI